MQCMQALHAVRSAVAVIDLLRTAWVLANTNEIDTSSTTTQKRLGFDAVTSETPPSPGGVQFHPTLEELKMAAAVTRVPFPYRAFDGEDLRQDPKTSVADYGFHGQ